jgi:hypothetical protein
LNIIRGFENGKKHKNDKGTAKGVVCHFSDSGGLSLFPLSTPLPLKNQLYRLKKKIVEVMPMI